VILQLELLQAQVPPLGDSIYGFSMSNSVTQHIKGRNPLSRHISRHEHLQLCQVLQDAVPCWKDDGGRVDDFVCELSQLGYGLGSMVSFISLIELTLASANFTGRTSFSSVIRSSASNTSTSSINRSSLSSSHLISASSSILALKS
jgi:hypothetical protein